MGLVNLEMKVRDYSAENTQPVKTAHGRMLIPRRHDERRGWYG